VGSPGRPGGGRKLAAEPDQFVTAKPAHCRPCGTALPADDHVLHARYDKIDLPPVRPVVTRVERYAGRCPGCGGMTVAPVPEGLEEGTPFAPGIVAAALYLRYVHALSSQRLTRLFRDLFGVAVSEGALDSRFRRARRHFDREVAAILTRLRRSRVICSDETTVRVNGRTCWNWVFQNEAVVIHVVRPTRAATVVNEGLDGHRPAFWVSDLYGGPQGHADLWQVCLAHHLRDGRYAIEAGDAVFAPRRKRVLLGAVVLARRRHDLAASTRREYRRRLDRDLDAIMALAPENRHGQRLRKRYAKLRDHLFTFLEHPEVPPDNNGCERELRPTATYRKVTGGFRSGWGADLFAGIKSVLGTAARHGLDAYQAIRQTLCGRSILDPG
jgi:transposase